jgi:hypothetical protein
LRGRFLGEEVGGVKAKEAEDEGNCGFFHRVMPDSEAWVNSLGKLEMG